MKTLILATAALLAAPALAQTAAPAAPAAPAAGTPKAEHPRSMHMQRGPMFGSVSPEGRKTLGEAMRASEDDRKAVRASRDRINALVGADKLDVAALKRAMDEERRLIDAQHAKRQAALLAAVQKLSAEDRKAFAADALKARADIEKRTAEWRKWADGRRKGGRDVPPPPPPPATPGV